MCSGQIGFPARATLVVVVAASLMATSGCGQATPPHPNATAPASSTSAGRSSMVAPQQILPDCQAIHVADEPKLRDQHIRCVLTVSTGLTLDVSSDPPWSFTLRKDGASIQQFREPVDETGETGAAPQLQDIDHSGTPVLLVVIGRGGSGGEPMAVWRLASPPEFVRAGEIFGFRRFYQTPEGLFGNYAHSSAASGAVTLYRWVNDKLVAVAVLDMQAAAASLPPAGHDWVHNGNVLCALNTEDEPPGSAAKRNAALRAAGIDPATAQQRLCTQPWVATIYR